MKESARIFKAYLLLFIICFSTVLSGCSTNPATGEQQFTSFMSPETENKVGAQEHPNILKRFGGIYNNKEITNYVNRIGQSLVKNTERSDVEYKFFVLDSPEANAFAVPGGYIYVTRGILALANDEAELAAVLAHEIGHITARHSAERYSHAVVTSLGVSIIGAAVNEPGAGDLANLGAGLYLNSYSRKQENQADILGVRYLHKAGYDRLGLTRFLTSLGAYSELEARVNGNAGAQPIEYFSTHPLTRDRVANTGRESQKYVANSAVSNKKSYLSTINGLSWGGSNAQGYVKGRDFIHPDMGFSFTAPSFSKINNRPSEVVISSKASGVAVLDIANAMSDMGPDQYIKQYWMKNEPIQGLERIDINGFDAATAAFPGHLNGRPAQVRLIAMKWAPRKFMRFQIALPSTLQAAEKEEYKRMTYSFKRIKKSTVGKGSHITLISANAGDSIESFARRQEAVFGKYSAEYFRVLNGLFDPKQTLYAGKSYKVVKSD